MVPFFKRRRMENYIYVPLPTDKERIEMIKQMLHPMIQGTQISECNWKSLLALTEGYSSSDLNVLARKVLDSQDACMFYSKHYKKLSSQKRPVSKAEMDYNKEQAKKKAEQERVQRILRRIEERNKNPNYKEPSREQLKSELLVRPQTNVTEVFWMPCGPDDDGAIETSYEKLPPESVVAPPITAVMIVILGKVVFDLQYITLTIIIASFDSVLPLFLVTGNVDFTRLKHSAFYSRRL